MSSPPCSSLPGSTHHDIDTACYHYDLAVTLQAQGQYTQALSHGHQALTQFEHDVGPLHPDIANVLNTLAEITAALDAYAEAQQWAQRSVAIMAQMAPGHEALERIRIQSYTTLATIYRMQGRYDDADALLQYALTLAEDTLGPEDLEVAAVLNNLAMVDKYQGRFPDAKQRYQKAALVARMQRDTEALTVAARGHGSQLTM